MSCLVSTSTTVLDNCLSSANDGVSLEEDELLSTVVSAIIDFNALSGDDLEIRTK